MERLSNEVEKLSPVTVRVQELFDHLGLNASSATKALGYNTTSKLYKILQGSEPSLPTLVDFQRKWPELSLDWLVLGEGPMLRGQTGAAAAATSGRAVVATGLPVVNGGKVLAITVDKDGNDNLELVPIHAQAGYAVQHNEAVFVQDLPRFRVPGFEHGKYRAFEVAGDSMEPTLNHRDIVICSYVDNWRLLVPDDMYVVVTTEAVMLKRIRLRITDLDSEVLLHSDNPHRRPYPLDAADITELWRVRGYLSTYLPTAPDVTVERLWEVIEALGFDKGEVRRHLDENATPDATR
jgi:Peptidase S24-like